MEREKLLALNNLTSIRIINLNPLISGDTARNFKGLLASCSAPPTHGAFDVPMYKVELLWTMGAIQAQCRS